MTTKELNGRQARWAERLSAFDFVIQHRPGSRNPADAPSRRPDYERDRASHTMLSTLQEKLRRGMLGEQEPSSSELRRVMAEEIREGQGPTQGPVASTACGLEDVMDVDSPDERLAAGATRVPVLLVPRLLAAAAAATETAYTDMPMPVTELLLMAQ